MFTYLRFCAFARVSLCRLVLLVLLVSAKSFRKKNKEFKTALITSFILLLMANTIPKNFVISSNDTSFQFTKLDPRRQGQEEFIVFSAYLLIFVTNSWINCSVNNSSKKYIELNLLILWKRTFMFEGETRVCDWRNYPNLVAGIFCTIYHILKYYFFATR